MEKRDLNKKVVAFMKKIPNIDYFIILNSEGIPITNVASSRDKRRDPDYLSSILRVLVTPSLNMKSAYDTSEHLITVSMFSKMVIVQINLETHYLAFIMDKSKWPISIEGFYSKLKELYLKLSHIKNHRKSLLKIVYAGEQKTDEEKMDKAAKKLQKAEQCFQSFSAGDFTQYDIEIPTSDPEEACKIIGNGLTNFCMKVSIVSEEGNIIYQNKEQTTKLSYINLNYLQNQEGDFENLQAGHLILSIHYFMDGEVFVSSPLGQIDTQRIDLTNQMANWNVGFNEIVSYNYTAAANVHNLLQSEVSNDFIELINYLLSDINSLQQEIESYLNSNQFNKAISLMNRAVYILQNNGQYSNSGDFLKWIGYTYFEAGEIQNSIKNYLLASKDYKKAGDYQNLANDYTDLGSVYETIDKPASAMKYYEEAKRIYQDIENQAQVQAIDEKISELEAELTQKLQDYVQSRTFKSKSISKMAQELELNAEALPKSIQKLIRNNKIKGSINLRANTYSKKGTGRTLPKVTVPSSGSSSSMSSSKNQTSEDTTPNYENAQQEKQQLLAENRKLDADISNIENKISRTNLSIMDFLKYQGKIQKRNLNKLKVRIYEEQPTFNAADGSPSKCVICLKEFMNNDKIVVGSGFHGFHTKCISKWIKTQDKCPVCDQRLLPSIFEESDLSTSVAMGDPQAEEKMERLKGQIKTLKQSLGGDADLFDKLVMERENKARLMRDINKKDQTIRELKSQLKVYKRRG